jgi:hypothetical protein
MRENKNLNGSNINNAVNDLTTQYGGGGNASNDEADSSIISSPRNNLRVSNANDRVGGVNEMTYSNENKNSLRQTENKHNLPKNRLQGPIKLR